MIKAFCGFAQFPKADDGIARLLKKGKVHPCTVQALRLCTGRTAHRGSRGVALLFLDHDTRRG